MQRSTIPHSMNSIHHRCRARPGGDSGFALSEVLIAQTILLVGILAICGVFVSVSQHREQTAVRMLAMERAQSVVEAIRAATPATVAATFHGQGFSIPGVDGANGDGSVIAVNVDDSDPTMLIVMVTGNWIVGGATHSFTLRTDIFNEDG